MSKLIAVWGPPNTGKTTFTVKLATALESQGKSVYVVLADQTTPALPTLFPTKKAEDMYSLGAALARADTTQKDIEANSVTVQNHANLCFLGYKDGENRHTYPQAYDIKCLDFLTLLKDMADIVLVDCTAVPDTLSKTAMANADLLFRVVSPDLKCVSFCSSQLPLMADPVYQCDKHIIVMNVNTSDVFPAVYDAEHYFGENVLTLPFCSEIRLQSFNGELTKGVMDKKFNIPFSTILSKIPE